MWLDFNLFYKRNDDKLFIFLQKRERSEHYFKEAVETYGRLRSWEIFASIPNLSRLIESTKIAYVCSSKINYIHYLHPYRFLDSLVVECWLPVWEVPGSIPSQAPPPRYPSGRVLASSVGGPRFNPQSSTASSIP